jgi:hypothetical protein
MAEGFEDAGTPVLGERQVDDHLELLRERAG